MSHLWEIDHPYYGPDSPGETFESFADLREAIDACDQDMNHAYRWDWVDYSQPHHDALFVDGEDRSRQELRLFLVQPRRSAFWSVSCPVTHDQEAEVLEWLRGPRVLGALRRLWEPLLDTPPTT